MSFLIHMKTNCDFSGMTFKKISLFSLWETRRINPKTQLTGGPVIRDFWRGFF